MKIDDLNAIEKEQIDLLRARSLNGDNQAAKILLSYLQKVSRNIDKWRKNKQREGGTTHEATQSKRK